MASEKMFRSLSGSEIQAVFGNVKFADLQMLKYAVSRQKVPVYTMGSADLRAIARGPRSINGALVFSHLSTQGLVSEMAKAGNKVFLSHDELANYNEDYQKGDKLTPSQKLALKSGGTIGYEGFVTNNSNVTTGSPGKGNSNNNSSALQGSIAGAVSVTGTPGATGVFDPFAVGDTFKSISNLANYGRVTRAWLADQLPPFDITLVGISETAGNELSANADSYAPEALILRGVEFVSESSGTSIQDLVIEKQMAFIARSIKDWHDINYG